jgi:hypothetical protein
LGKLGIALEWRRRRTIVRIYSALQGDISFNKPSDEKIDSIHFIWEQNLLHSIDLMMKAILGRG